MGLYSPPSSATAPPATLAVSISIPSIASAVVLLAANPNRKGMMIYNSSNARLSVSLNPEFDQSACALVIEPFSTYRMDDHFVGRIMGIWASADGHAIVTEFS